jgi:hypothetical protein
MGIRRVVVVRVAGSVAAAALGLALATAPAGATGTPAAWRVQTSPDPSPGDADQLNAVAMASGGAWAVGSTEDSSFYPHTLILRHSSSGWAQVASPGPAGGVLAAVAASSNSDAWAVGWDNLEDNVLVLHWDGVAWSVQRAPYSGNYSTDPPFSTGLKGVVALSASNAWAVGRWGGPYPLIEHWNGTRWTKQCCASTDGGGSLNAVAATNGTHMWAVGQKYDGAWHVAVRTWNGTRWSSQPTPDPRHGDLVGVTAVSATNVWAVGNYVNSNKLFRTLVLHYDGTSWQKVASPNVGTGKNVLSAVHAVSADNVWAVGHAGTKPLIEHYDGTTWTVATLPDVGNGALTGVAGNAFAVGAITSYTSITTLVLHYS